MATANVARFLLRQRGFVAAVTVSSCFSIAYTKSEPSRKDDPDSTFDLSKSLQSAKDWASSGFLKNIVDDATTDQSKDEQPEESSPPLLNPLESMLKGLLSTAEDNEQEAASPVDAEEDASFFSMAKNLATLLSGGDNQDKALEKLVEQARDAAASGDVQDSHTFVDVRNVMQQTMSNLDRILEENFGHLDLSYFTAAALFYYLEREDEVKNPSWKRMKHRFHGGVDSKNVNELNKALLLSEASYADSLADLKSQLDKQNLQLVYFQPESMPGRPSHFVAVRKGQSFWSPALKVVICVRGTKDLSDVITDLLLEATEYRGGKAHAGILESGKWLVVKHLPLLNKLRSASKKGHIELQIVGHSLGAGAASIAGIEFNQQPKINAHVIGFGCPALLSKDLSEECKGYVTTVVADADVIPRCSGATLANMALNVMEYNRFPKIRRDVQQALQELRNYSSLVTESGINSVITSLDNYFIDNKDSLVKPATNERLEAVLFPPGTCVHFYRDGSGISGSVAPCSFFDEIDVSRTMVDDHTIKNGYRRIFLDLARQDVGDLHFRFDDDQ